MKSNQLILLLVAVILAIAVFLPVVTIPFAGGINAFRNGQGDGKYILLLAAVAAVLTFTRFLKLVAVPGVIALVMLCVFYYRFRDIFNQVDHADDGSFAGNLSKMFAQSVSLSYGFIIMFICALALTLLPLMLPPSRAEA